MNSDMLEVGLRLNVSFEALDCNGGVVAASCGVDTWNCGR
jgi:hypothetical protein